MPAAYLTMSHRELDRSEVMHRLLERRLSQQEAATMLGLSVRQTERLLAGVQVSVTTLRRWMAEDGLWRRRKQRAGRAQRPRN